MNAGFEARLTAAAAAVGDPGPVTVLLGVGGGHRGYRPGSVTAARSKTSPLLPTLPAVAAGRVVRVGSQSAVGNFGLQCYEAVLRSFTAQWGDVGLMRPGPAA